MRAGRAPAPARPPGSPPRAPAATRSQERPRARPASRGSSPPPPRRSPPPEPPLDADPRCSRRRPTRDRRCRTGSSRRALGSPVQSYAARRGPSLTALQLPEDLLDERSRRCRDRGGALGDRGLGPDLLSGMQRLAEEPVEHRTGRAHLEGGADLAKDLALAGDERVEPRGDPEEMER